MLHLLTSPNLPIFVVAGVMEVRPPASLSFRPAELLQLPTFDLAISHLFPSMRNDLRFLTTFFVLRIAFHTVYLADCMRPSSRLVTNDSWLPSILIALAGVLHVAWFHGGLNGYLKRKRSAKKQSLVETLDQPIDTLVKVDPTILEALPTTPEAQTPDDSPLVTPHTPSIAPMSLRDSYLFPNITMPTMPNLPTMSIPAISSMSIPTILTFSDMAAAFPKSLNTEHLGGFKHAVRLRWDEQRGMFAGMSPRGRGMSMRLSGLGFRKRGEAFSMEEDETHVVIKEVEE